MTTSQADNPRQPGRRGRGFSISASFMLTVSFVLLALIPVVLITAITTWNSLQREQSRVRSQVSTLGDLYEQALEFQVENTRETLDTLVNDSVTRENMRRLLQETEAGASAGFYAQSRADFQNTTQGLLNSSGAQLEYIVLTDLEGVVRGSSDITLLNRDLGSESWLQATRTNPALETQLSGPSFDPITNGDNLYFTRTVTDDLGIPIGVLTVSVSIDLLSETIGTLPRLGETSDVYLVRAGRLYVVPPTRDPNASLANDTIIERALSGVSDVGSWTDYRGIEVTGTYRWIEPLDMTLIIKQDNAEAVAAVQPLLRTNLLISLIIATVMIGLSYLVTRRVTRPINQLYQAARAIMQGGRENIEVSSRLTEMTQLSDTLSLLDKQIRELVATREQIVEARTRELRITAQMGRIIAAETNLDNLLGVTVNMIRERLGYYHAQVFLIDDLKQFAVLKASTGEAGRQLLSRNHKLPVNSRSVIGQVASKGEPVLASDTRYAEYWLPNPLLPRTRAEVAVPLRLGDQVIGALDVQSVEPDAFDEPTVATLQTIADQLAVAIRNAQLFEEKEGLLSASLELTQMLTRENWESFVSQRGKAAEILGYYYDLTDLRQIGPDSTPHTEGNAVNLPISLRGEVIGELSAALPEGQELSTEQADVIDKVLDRVAIALENARLFEQTQSSLMETNRLFEASRLISEADSVGALIDELVELSRIEGADVIALYLQESSGPEDQRTERWVRRAALWTREPDDRFRDMPEITLISRPPLLGIEETDPEGEVISDVLGAESLPEATLDALTVLGVRSMATFPLVVSRRVLGWLRLHSRQIGGLDRADVRYLQTVADQAATALEGLRLLDQTQQRARRLQHTNEVSRAASSILNPDILLPLVVDQIGQAFGYYHVQVFIVDEMGRFAELRASTGEVGQELLRRKHKLEVGSQSVIGQVTSRGFPVIARDTDVDVVHRRNELLPNTRAEMAIPLKTGDRVIGALDVQSTEPNAFDIEAQAILQSLADQLSVTLENAQLFQEIQERVAELTTVNLVSQAVSRAETLEDLNNVVTVQLMRTFGAQYGYLGILNRSTNLIDVPIFIEGGRRLDSPGSFSSEEGIMGHVVRNQEVLLINENIEDEVIRLGGRRIGDMPKSLLAIPLTVGDEVLGVISIQDRDREHAYDESHVRQLSTLAAYIAVKIRNAELLIEAQRRAGELEFLFDLTRTAVSAGNLDEALNNVAPLIQSEIRGAESVLIYLLDEPGELMPHAAVGYGREALARGEIVRLGQGPAGEAARTLRSFVVHDTREAPFRMNGGARTHSALVVPLVSREEVIGVLMVESSQLRAFTNEQLQLLETASGTLTAIVQSARLLEQVNAAYAELQQLDSLKSQFLANMSHELRTPLNSIIGFSKVMLKGLDGPLTDVQKLDLTTIFNSGTHLLNLINEILDMSKIEAGKMEIQPDFIDLPEIVHEVQQTAVGLIAEKPLELKVEMPESLPEIYGDKVRVRQILLNLVSNAVKFTQQGTIAIRAHYHDPHPINGLPGVQIDVQDSGIGIAQEDMPKLFEAFRQVDGSMTRQAGGTGLGLPIAKEFVEMHNGRMWVESVVGTGSTFSFVIPTVVPNAPEPIAIDEPDTRELPMPEEVKEAISQMKAQEPAESAPLGVLRPEPHSPGSAPIVLAVDDEPGVLNLYVRFLSKEGYIVVTMNRADDILTRVREVRPSVIVMDLNMPGLNGWEAIHALKNDPETGGIPIIICSIEEDRSRAKELGVTDYLVKPIIEEELLEALQGLATVPGAPVDVHYILIIDPDVTYADQLRQTLQQFELTVVGHGYEGLNALQDTLRQPDAVIMDLNLPDMDGFGLLVAMRTHEVTRDVPVIVLTGRSLDTIQMERVDGAAVQYLRKDEVNDSDILGAIASLRRAR